MEVLNARTAFLSNHEVLSLLQELDTPDPSLYPQSNNPSAPTPSSSAPTYTYTSLPPNQRQIQLDLRAYLTSSHVEADQQTPSSVHHLVRGLREYGLTKAEKLQVVNLMPTAVVVLYTIIEDFEYRFPGNSAEGILQLVQDSQAMAASELAVTRPQRSANGVDDAGEEGEGAGGEAGAGAEEVLFLPDEELEELYAEQEGEVHMGVGVEGEGWEEGLDLPEEGYAELDEEGDGE